MTQTRTSAHSPHPKRILIADDDEDLVSLLTDGLRAEGYEVSGVGSGAMLRFTLLEAAVRLGQIPYDLILSDIRMPAGSGLDILAELSDLEGLPPIVLMTAFGSPQTHDAAFRLGAVTVIDKPFDVFDFCAIVSCICGAPRKGHSPLEEPLG